METGYAISKRLALSYDDAVTAVTQALSQEGFGVLTEIDVKGTLKKKLNVDFRRYVILGACNPPLAHQTLQVELQIGLLLPCNVIVYEDDEDHTVVAALNPAVVMGSVAVPGLAPVAEQVTAKLERVIASLG